MPRAFLLPVTPPPPGAGATPPSPRGRTARRAGQLFSLPAPPPSTPFSPFSSLLQAPSTPPPAPGRLLFHLRTKCVLPSPPTPSPCTADFLKPCLQATPSMLPALFQAAPPPPSPGLGRATLTPRGHLPAPPLRRYLAGIAGDADFRSPPLRFLASARDVVPARGSGPASFQAASPPGEGEAPVAAAAALLPLETLTEALLALFTAGDLGKKLYSVLCRDIATEAEAQPLCRTEPLEARHLPRGACWREIWGEVRSAGGTLAPAANRQAPGRARAASLAARVRPRPLGRPETRGGRGRPAATRGSSPWCCPPVAPRRVRLGAG